MGTERPPSSDETARHDEEGGRQLAAVCVVVGLAVAAIVLYVDASLQCTLCSLAILALGVLGVLWPVGAIRLVSGRFSELGDTTVRQPAPNATDAPAPTATASPTDASKPTEESVLEKAQSGIPIVTGLAEDAIKSKHRRAWAGIALMILGVILVGASVGFKGTQPHEATRVAQIGGAIVFAGLVLWYRTK